MRTTKELKKYIKDKASKNPDKFYATSILKRDGFIRKQCKNCNIYFWSVNKNQDVCGDSICNGGFNFFENNPAKEKLSYVKVWQKFSKMFEDFGYTKIKRYPTVARWNPTMEFTIASIAAFQPYVISGEVKAPAKKLVIPQFCVRFSDIENIGITAGHNTGFVMIGQHMFVLKEEWSQEKAFSDIKKWLNEGLGICDEELTFHEDAWAGGGNAGPCMEYFSRGLELGNQVYMLYEQTPNDELIDLKLKVLDMGMGMERNAWFSQSTSTQHQAIYPEAIEYLLKKTNQKIDEDFMKKFVPHSGKLNLDEIDDIDKAWQDVSNILEIKVSELKNKILPLSAIFSIADHTRTLLFTLNDGALPSNVGGGYNLRILLRRCFSFIDKYNYDINLIDVIKIHAQTLNEIFPELENNLENIKKIIDVEKEKYNATKEKTKQIVSSIIKKDITEKTLLELYDSNGISPELIINEAKKYNIDIKMPTNFFGKVSELHEKKEQIHSTKNTKTFDIQNIKETKANYFDDYRISEFEAKVLWIKDNFVILDKTLFYPTSGGQINDFGKINEIDVINVIKQGAYIIHELKTTPNFKVNDIVFGKIDECRRKQLSQHHTAAHIINAAARFILGKHVNQAGAKKTIKKAHLDLTHYKSISDDEIKKIEDKANEIVSKDIIIKKGFYERGEAEDKFGMDIYQGGAVPGKELRIVEIPGIDVEACGGTHLNSTKEVGLIKIEKTTKIQDGIIRLIFTAGDACNLTCNYQEELITKISKLLNVKKELIPKRSEEIFTLWKKCKKAKSKNKVLTKEELELKSNEISNCDILNETSKILKTQPEHIEKTLKRFLNDIEEYKKNN
ncbi:MAG: alanine--tRNA ligase [Nanoarchaeota archaeon]